MGAFDKVDLIPGKRCLHVYVLALCYKRANDDGGRTGDFLTYGGRMLGCDDLSNWCLTRDELLVEYKAHEASYENLWIQFAKALDTISAEFRATSSGEQSPSRATKLPAL